MYARAVEKHPTLQGVRGVIAKGRADRGERLEAVTMWDEVLASPQSATKPAAMLGAAQALYQLEERARANALAIGAAMSATATPEQMLAAARMLAQDESTRAVALATKAAEKSDSYSLGSVRISAADFLAQMGRTEEAVAIAQAGVKRAREAGLHIGQADTFFGAGVLFVRLGKPEIGLPLVRQAAKAARTSAWDAVPVVKFFREYGIQTSNQVLVDEGRQLMEAAAATAPDHPMILFELAMARYAAKQPAEALAAMKAAAEIGATSALLADRYAQLLGEGGQAAEAARWKEEARRRAAAKLGG